MELEGKKVNFLGDSITWGGCASTIENCFVDVMKRRYGLAEARNYGISGTRIARQHTPSEAAVYDQDFCGRAGSMEKDVDVIVVLGGTNDYGHGDAPMGREEDRTPDTFIGACHFLFRTLLESYPGTKIVVLTPLRRLDQDVPKGELGLCLEDYVNQIKHIAEIYAIPVLDLYEVSAIRASDPEIAARLTTDGLHPNDMGHAILAEEIGEYLKTL